MICCERKTDIMQTFHDTARDSARGLGLLLALNWDRILFLAAILLALSASAWLRLL